MKVDLDDLLTVEQVADLCGLSPHTIRQRRNWRDFPLPVRVFGSTRVYLRQDIEEWRANLPRGQGGPGKARPSRRKRT